MMFWLCRCTIARATSNAVSRIITMSRRPSAGHSQQQHSQQQRHSHTAMGPQHMQHDLAQCLKAHAGAGRVKALPP